MRRAGLALILLLVWLPLVAMKIAELSFEADFECDVSALEEASGLKADEEYSPERVEEAIQSIHSYLKSIDQYYVMVPMPTLIPLGEDRLKLKFELIQKADPTRITLKIKGLRYLSEYKLREYLRLNDDSLVSLSQLKGIKEKILGIYRERNHLFASVRLDSLVIEDKAMVAYLFVDEGKPLNIRQYHFEGNKISKEDALLKSSGLLEEREISLKSLERAEERLRAKPYIKDCTFSLLDEENLLIRIEEGRMSRWEAILGFRRERDKTKLSGMANISFMNIGGRDRQIDFLWRKTAASFSELKLSYHESGFQAVPVAANLSFQIEAQDTIWSKYYGEIDVFYHNLQHKLGLSLFQGKDLYHDLSVSSSQKGLGILYHYSSLSGGRIPLQGWEFKVNSAQVLKDLKDGDEDIKESFPKVELSLSKHSPLGKGFVAYLKAVYKESFIKHPMEMDYLFLGGHQSLRGYYENEFKSKLLASFTAELRYMLQKEAMLYLFYDQGLIRKIEDNFLKYDISGLGLGLRYGTRLGLLSIEYALGYRDKSFSSLSLGMIHLGLSLDL